MALPPIIGRLVGDDSHFRGVMRGAAGAVGVLGGALAAVGVGSFFKNAVMGASDLEEQLNKVNTVFGESVGGVTKFADQMAKDFGLSKTTILDAAGSIGLIGKASGLSQGEAAKMSTEMSKLAADASSFYNVPLEEALLAIRSGLVGEAEPMRRFGVLLSAEAVDAKAAAMGFKKRGAAFDEGAKSQARAALIMEGMKDASGDLERTQGSLSNRLRELKGRFENFSAEIGAKAIPVVLKMMDAGERLQARLAPAFKEIGGGFRAFVAAFKANDGDITSGGFAGTMERMAFSARQVWERVQEVWPKIQATIMNVVSAVIGFVQEQWPRIREVVGEVLSTVVALISGVVEIIMAIWNNFGSQIVSVLKSTWDFVMNIVDAAMNIIRGIIDVVTGIIKGDWSRVWEGIQSIFSGVWDAIKAIVEHAINLIQEVISVGWEIVGAIFAAAWEAIKAGTVAAIKGLVNLIVDLPGMIVGALGDLGMLLWDAGVRLIKGFIGGIVSMIGSVKDTLVGLAGKLTSWKGPPAKDATMLYQAGRLVMGGFDKGLRDGIPAVRSTLESTTGMIGNMGSATPHLGTSAGGTTVVVVIGDREFARVMAPANRDALIDLGRHLPGGAFGAAA